MNHLLNIGRKKQLLLDEDLCDASENINFTMNPPCQTGEVLVKPDRHYEKDLVMGIFDSVRKEGDLIRLWYTCCHPNDGPNMHLRRVCYAESTDGIHFNKPELNLVEMGGTMANNAVISDPIQGGCVWIDPKAPPEERYRTQAKWGPFPTDKSCAIHFYASPDGIRWKHTHFVDVGCCDSQTVVFWDESYGRYVMYTRKWQHFDEINWQFRRIRRLESDDLINWDNETIVFEADEVDNEMHITSTGRPPLDYYGGCVYKYPEADNLYILLAEAYWHWKDMPEEDKYGYSPDPTKMKLKEIFLDPATIDVQLAYSKDGKNFKRAVDRKSFIRTGLEGRFDSGMLWALPNPIEMGDEIWIYYDATNIDHNGFVDPAAPCRLSGIGRAVMRKDGFVSADADYSGGWLVTPTITFQGSRLELNVDAAGGGMVQVEVLDENGNSIEGFSKEDAHYLCGNSVDVSVTWEGSADIRRLAGRPVKLKFHMRNCKLYAFQFK